VSGLRGATFRLDGKVAVVTGAARGIGRGIAERLARAGAEVHAFDREPPPERAPAGPASHGGDGFGAPAGVLGFHALDITDPAAVDRAVASLPRPPTLLVNNAGITRDRSLLKMSDDEWRSVLDVNLTGAFHLIRAVGPGMVGAGHGRIVNIASINGLRGKFGQGNYAASKAGLIGLTKTAARELGPKGITVNAVAPGMVLTDMTLALAEEHRKRAIDETVLKQLPDVEDIAAAVLFLLSDAARLITGEVIRVDAGQYI
jgi:acetoacetyl-CoA reductase/3-oxoacyl-[acyl-carrier protein] reductase